MSSQLRQSQYRRFAILVSSATYRLRRQSESPKNAFLGNCKIVTKGELSVFDGVFLRVVLLMEGAERAGESMPCGDPQLQVLSVIAGPFPIYIVYYAEAECVIRLRIFLLIFAQDRNKRVARVQLFR